MKIFRGIMFTIIVLVAAAMAIVMMWENTQFEFDIEIEGPIYPEGYETPVYKLTFLAFAIGFCWLLIEVVIEKIQEFISLFKR